MRIIHRVFHLLVLTAIVGSVGALVRSATSALPAAARDAAQTTRRDVAEPSEPNDYTRVLGLIHLASANEIVSLIGCIDPVDADRDGELEPDIDVFRVSVAAPTLLSVRVEGVRGLAPAFVLGAEDGPAAQFGWTRIDADASSSVTEEVTFVPAAGSYLLTLLDARTLLADVAAGGEGSCYTADLQLQGQPTLEALAPTWRGTLDRVRAFAPQLTHDVRYVLSLANDSDKAQVMATVLVGGEYAGTWMASASDVATTVLTSDHDSLVLVLETSMNASSASPHIELRLTPEEPGVIPPLEEDASPAL